MKQLLIGAAFVLVSATSVFAGTKTVLYPEQYCEQILSQEYSTGGGDTMWQMLEILCRDANGDYHGFAVSWGSAAGFLGIGRFAHVERFIYQPYSGNTLKIQ
jgi:hypothetical protein